MKYTRDERGHANIQRKQPWLSNHQDNMCQRWFSCHNLGHTAPAWSLFVTSFHFVATWEWDQEIYLHCSKLCFSFQLPLVLKTKQTFSFILLGIAGIPVVFNVNGDAPGRYEIYQYQIRNNTTEYKIIGHWTDQLHLDVRLFYTVYLIFHCNKQLFVLIIVTTGYICLWKKKKPRYNNL